MLGLVDRSFLLKKAIKSNNTILKLLIVAQQFFIANFFIYRS